MIRRYLVFSFVCLWLATCVEPADQGEGGPVGSNTPTRGGMEEGAGEVAGGLRTGDGTGGGEVTLNGGEDRGTTPCIPRGERCNLLDDDCDGLVDEGFQGLGEACTSGLGACMGEGVISCAESQSDVVCATQEGAPSEEECDQVDNDCDGDIDEGIRGCCDPNSTRECGVGVGVCVLGSQTCTENGWTPCDAPSPLEEACDGEDNDCDGRVDEGTLNSCGACGGLIDETCDNMDNDCDGLIDENLVGDRCSQGSGGCGSMGNLVCVNGAYVCDATPGAPSEERCNGVDDDCDGDIDENVIRGTCSVGVGACARSGSEICVNGSFVCDANPRSPSSEQCDRVDNDCDGRTDEDLSGGLCAAGVGECRQTGEEVCINGAFVCDATPRSSTSESCDGNDNDCDGRTDEGVLNACGGCGATPAEVCDGADNDCDGRTDERVQNACGGCGAVPVEECDARDNDCDGNIDEGLNLGGTCAVGVGSCRRTGTRYCTDQGTIGCTAVAGSPSDEVCGALMSGADDLQDEDCDGSVDEGFDKENDVFHCGGCIRYCLSGDSCLGGACYCNGGPACPNGSFCINGFCQSIPIP